MEQPVHTRAINTSDQLSCNRRQSQKSGNQQDLITEFSITSMSEVSVAMHACTVAMHARGKTTDLQQDLSSADTEGEHGAEDQGRYTQCTHHICYVELTANAKIYYGEHSLHPFVPQEPL